MAQMIHDPGNFMVIDELYVGMGEDPDGKNGIIGMFVPGLGATPMVSASKNVLEQMKKQAVEASKQTDRRIVIYRFVRAEPVFTIGGSEQ